MEVIPHFHRIEQAHIGSRQSLIYASGSGWPPNQEAIELLISLLFLYATHIIFSLFVVDLSFYFKLSMLWFSKSYYIAPNQYYLVTGKIEMQKWCPSNHVQHKAAYINKVTHLNLYSPLWTKRKAFINDALRKDSLYIGTLHRESSKNAWCLVKNMYFTYIYGENKHYCILNSALVPFICEIEVNI